MQSLMGFFKPEEAVEQKVKSAIWDIMKLMWCYCSITIDNALLTLSGELWGAFCEYVKR